MKKRILSCLMALALCLTLLPTAALAEETEGTAQTPPAVEKAADPANREEQQENQPAAPKQENQSAEQEEQQEDSAAKHAVAAVQAMISELPSLGELKGMDSDTLNEAYMAVQSTYDAYETLSEEQQAQVTGADRFEELFGWFNSQVAPLRIAQISTLMSLMQMAALQRVPVSAETVLSLKTATIVRPFMATNTTWLKKAVT